MSELAFCFLTFAAFLLLFFFWESMVSAIDKWTLWHILKERTALVNGTERNHLYVCLRNDDEYLIMGDLELQV